MKINEKIRFLRESKNWSQEEMASKLGMSTYGYSKIERGETRLNIPKLEQIGDVLDMDILELMSIGERNVIFFQQEDNNTNYSSNIVIGTNPESNLEIQNLKLALAQQEQALKHKNEIIEMQKREIENLQRILILLESKMKEV